MKIACLISSLRLGGAERQLIGLAETLSSFGHDVEIVTYHKEDFYESLVAEKGLKHKLLHGKGTSGIIHAIAELDADLLISFLAGTNLKACLAKRFNRRMKLVVSERNCNTSFHFHDWVRFATYHHFADRVLCNNYSQEEFIRKHFPKLAPKLSTIPNFVDTETFRPSEEEKACGNRIIVASRICRRKNVHGLIEAAAILRESGIEDFVTVWYGLIKENSYVGRCRKLIEKYGLGNCFHLLPATSAIAQKYREADFFCLPSFYEGTSNALAEALSSGLPVVCSDVSDNSRYVKPWKNGFLFDPHDPVRMASELRNMLSLTREMRLEMSSASRDVALKGLGRESFAEGYKKLLESLKD